MIKKKNNEFEIDIINFILGCFVITGLLIIIIFSYKYITVIEEKECIDYYINTGYVLEECSNYENLKK